MPIFRFQVHPGFKLEKMMSWGSISPRVALSHLLDMNVRETNVVTPLCIRRLFIHTPEEQGGPSV